MLLIGAFFFIFLRKNYMTKNLFYLLPIFILLFSCRNSDNESDIKAEQEFLVKRLNPIFSPEGYNISASGPGVNSYFEFEYDSKNRITKRIGSVLQVSTYSYVFTDRIAIIIKYNNSSASIKKIDIKDPNSTIIDIEENILFNNSNQIIEKNIPSLNHNSKYDKRIKYFYNNKTLVKRETTYPNKLFNTLELWEYIETIVEDYIYDSNSNLQKIVTTSHKAGSINSVDKIKEITFGDYDTSKNPFVKLGILNDYFERSLSKNNFRSRAEISYNIDGKPYKGSENTWNYPYDSTGNLILE